MAKHTRGIDLKAYGIDCDKITFNQGRKKTNEGGNMLIRQESFSLIISIVRQYSLKAAFLLTIYKKLVSSHHPEVQLSFKELAKELESSSRVLRRYTKQLRLEELLLFGKVKDDRYLFSMGAKFGQWLWNSNHFKNNRKDYVDNSEKAVDNFKDLEPEGVRSGPPNDQKGSVVDPQRDHSGPPLNRQFPGLLEEISKKSPTVFSSSSLFMSSAKAKHEETNVSGKNGTAPVRDRTPQDLALQTVYLNETNGLGVSYKEWLQERNAV